MRDVLARVACFVTAALAALGSPTLAIAQQQSAPDYGPHMWSGSWYGSFFGPIMMIVFIAVAVVVVVLVVRGLGGAGRGGTTQVPSDKTPLDILKERFAKGEIDKEEFEERRRVLDE